MSRSVKTLAWAIAAAGALATGAAQARSDVYWSIDIVAPGYPVGVGASVSNAPRMVYPAPVVVAPPLVYAPPAVVYAPRPIYVAAPPVLYVPPGHAWGKKRWQRVPGTVHSHHHHHHHRPDHHHGHGD